jgi:hypothetical protein
MHQALTDRSSLWIMRGTNQCDKQACSASAVGTAASSSSTSSNAAAAPAPSSSSRQSMETREIALSGDQITYLDLMRDRYSLGTIDKTARCLVNYARQDGDQRFIFGTYRCRTCGIKFPKQRRSITLYAHQWAFLDRMKEEMKIEDPEKNGKVVRVLLDFTQVSGDSESDRARR